MYCNYLKPCLKNVTVSITILSWHSLKLYLSSMKPVIKNIKCGPYMNCTSKVAKRKYLHLPAVVVKSNESMITNSGNISLNIAEIWIYMYFVHFVITKLEMLMSPEKRLVQIIVTQHSIHILLMSIRSANIQTSWLKYWSHI